MLHNYLHYKFDIIFNIMLELIQQTFLYDNFLQNIMFSESIELYIGLLKYSHDIIDYTKNVKTFVSKFSSQFTFLETNDECFNKMYLKDNKDVIPRKDYFPLINNLEPTCKDCWRYYLSPRNKSIKGLDIQLGKKFQIKIIEYLMS